ncbi:MAG: class II glutamine amidotransferase [Lachnospiraceae bacterium]|nr:class II glutamine amidotransferase [Lachnospiraceae bacterium]
MVFEQMEPVYEQMEPDGLHEECGVFGIYDFSGENVASTIYYGLFALQHRGQESCGIAVSDTLGPKGKVLSHKGMGLVNEVFTGEHLAQMKGDIGIGHVRYSTAGGSTRENAQPLVLNYIKGTLALAHNGNLINTPQLRRELELGGSIFQTTIDTEVIAYHIARERVRARNVEEAVANAMKKLKGAYSLIIMSPRKLIGARDPYGFRPLCIGKRDNAYILASETCALDTIGAEFVRDVEPGEIVTIAPKHKPQSHSQRRMIAGGIPGEQPAAPLRAQSSPETTEEWKIPEEKDKDTDGASAGIPGRSQAVLTSDRAMCFPPERQCETARCVFEYIYFGRADSYLDGISVYDSRIRAGRFLAKDSPVEADLVVGVPESGNVAALGFSLESGIPYGMAFMKNSYVGRTFIKPGQSSRESSVRVKLNVLREAVEGKRVIMIDDSIVRGTTSDRIVRMLRDAGAKEVHMRVSSPPFLYPCYFGTDVPAREQLIAYNREIEDIRQIIGADSLAYLRMDRLPELTSGLPICNGCFTGNYPMDPPQEDIRGEYEH